ncbi:hypothetical protein LguiA_009728 [Lonicera macranthoides]
MTQCNPMAFKLGNPSLKKKEEKICLNPTSTPPFYFFIIPPLSLSLSFKIIGTLLNANNPIPIFLSAMDEFRIKQETIEHSQPSKVNPTTEPSHPVPVIDLSSSDSDSYSSSSSSSEEDDDVVRVNGKRSRVSNDGVPSKNKTKKKKKMSDLSVVLPAGFLDPLPAKVPPAANVDGIGIGGGCKQFWKAGDFEGTTGGNWDMSTAASYEWRKEPSELGKSSFAKSFSFPRPFVGLARVGFEGGIDHVRVHPRFLHSNATSHQWVLGAFAELLDNSLDEVCNGATYVNIDMIKNKKDESRMLRIEGSANWVGSLIVEGFKALYPVEADNGGGMDPDKMRQCMSLGYSLKSKVADTIGQYGNGFKTSTMRLGADVIVFSRCSGKDGKRPTQSIGLLSYTFLRSTGKEDIVVPMLDYERAGQEWNRIIRSSVGDWNKNVETIIKWSPFSNEADLLRQFNQMKEHGTTVIIYNLWEDDQGLLELDFDTDKHDIQIRGVNRDEKNIQMAQQFPNSRHFLTYKHSLRSYASILYLRIPPGFRIILRGKDVERHNIVNDMMFTEEVTYRPQPGADGVPKDTNMVAVVTVGFVKDAKSHIDVQGFNVYHKNRLIKPFWRVWNASGSDGRGVIGVLEANFVEPAHDKQGFERTTVLSRLETRLVQMQKIYWYTLRLCSSSVRLVQVFALSYPKLIISHGEFGFNINAICHLLLMHSNFVESSPDYTPQYKKKNAASSKTPVPSDKFASYKNHKQGRRESEQYPKTADNSNDNGHLYGTKESKRKLPTKTRRSNSLEPSSPSAEDINDDDLQTPSPHSQANGNSQKASSARNFSRKDDPRTFGSPAYSGIAVQITPNLLSKGNDVTGNGETPTSCNLQVLEQLKEENRDLLHDLKYERDRSESLDAQLQEATKKIEELNKEQESLIGIFSEERERRELEEENLRKKLKDASNTIQQLVDKVKLLEKLKPSSNYR